MKCEECNHDVHEIYSSFYYCDNCRHLICQCESCKQRKEKMKKQSMKDKLDEKLGMKDGKESSKKQSMKSRRDESKSMKKGKC